MGASTKTAAEFLTFRFPFSIFLFGHPNKMFCFPSPSTRKVGSVGRSDEKINNQKIILK